MKSNRPEIDFIEHQADLITSLRPKFLGLVGGYRSGKTYATCHKGLYMTFMNPGYDGALLMPTNAMVRRVLIPTMQEVLQTTGAWRVARLVKSDPKFVIETPGGPTNIYLLSAENYTRAAGLSLAWWGIDEMDLIETQLAEESFRMMVSRLTNGPHMQGWTTSTPEGHKFLYKFFVEDVETAIREGKPLTDRRLIRAKTADNPFITKDYIETLTSQYPPHLLKAYLDGEFVNMNTGLVYPDYDRALNFTELTVDSEEFKNLPLHIGIDFNVGKNHTVVSVVKHHRPYVVDEIVGLRDTPAVIKEIRRRYPDRAIYMYPDASGGNESSNAEFSNIQLLENAGFEIDAPRKNPRVENRIAAVNAKICNGRNERTLKINPDKCPTLVKSLDQLAYNTDGKVDKDPLRNLDHSPDALGYFINRNWPITREVSTGLKSSEIAR